jgi:ketosteroid isomerase-like protein
MSQEGGEIVRKPFHVRGGSSRSFDHRLALWFPRLAGAYLRLLGRLPPTSRLRQAVLWRTARLSLEAWNRRDLDAFQVGRHAACAIHPAPELVEAGLFESCYRGPEGYRKYLSTFFEALGPDFRMESAELIDLGDRFVILGHIPARGRTSGVPLTQDFGWVITVKDGKATDRRQYLDHAQALEAAGVESGAKPLQRSRTRIVRKSSCAS